MEKQELTPAQRLIVAADFPPDRDGRIVTHTKMMGLAKSLKGSGVCIKVNADLRTWGYGLINELREFGLSVFADLKLVDIGATLGRDGQYLCDYAPDIVTVMCAASNSALKAIKAALPKTLVIGVTVLTDIPAEEVQRMYGCDVPTQAMRFAEHGVAAGLDGLVCSPKEAAALRKRFPEIELITPGVRDPGMTVKSDDQKRVTTPREALAAGATRLAVGRPIVGQADPHAAAMRFVAAIEEAVMQDKSALLGIGNG